MTEPITVLRLTPAFDWRVVEGADRPAEAIGGLANQVALQVAAVGALGLRQLVIAMAVEGAPRRATTVDGAQILGVGRARARGVHRRNASWLLGAMRALRRLERRPDVVHVHASGLLEPLLASIGARLLLRRPVVLTLHCSAQFTYVTQSRRDAIVQVLTRGAERAAIHMAARTLVLTERVARRLGPGAEVMPDWVRWELFSTSSDTSAAREFAACYDLPDDRPVAIYVGRVSREKGWPALVELAARLSDLRLQILVCGDGVDRQALELAARSRGVREAFTFADEVRHEDVAAAMACAHVLVLPSSHEELGSVLIEAMASGLPAVAYDVGGTSEAVQDGVTGLLVAAGNLTALAAAVRRVLEDPSLRQRARIEGPRRAREHFAADACGARLAALYEAVAH